jgi:DNA-binding transcriptional LysR family regulator
VDRLRALEVFKTVVEKGSFVKAAEALGLSTTAASRTVSDLEHLLGVRLLQRTTRRIGLTTEGSEVLDQASRLLETYEELSSVNRMSQSEPSGEIRVNAPVSYGTRRLGPVLASFMEQYPRVVIDLQLTDRVVDLIDENVDVAIRISRDLKSTLIARRIADAQLRLLASPGYLARHGTPQHPSDLAGHRLLNYTYLADRNYWHFTHADTGEQARVPVSGALSANNGDVLVAAAIHDAGIAMQPDFLADEALASGALQELLPHWRTAPLGVYAVYASRRYQALRVRRWIEHLALTLGQAGSA